MKIRLACPLQQDSIVDGEGIRTVIWTQGCAHKCQGCHNPQTHDFNKGYEVDIEDVKKTILQLNIQDGVTLSGGDPFFQAEASKEIARFCKEQGLSVWAYTGFTYERLSEMMEYRKDIRGLMENVDVLIDGKFDPDERSLNLQFRGSKNQRVIDVKESMECGCVVEIEKYNQENNYMGYDELAKEKEYLYI